MRRATRYGDPGAASHRKTACAREGRGVRGGRTGVAVSTEGGGGSGRRRLTGGGAMPMVPAEFTGERGTTALVSLFLASSREAAAERIVGGVGIRTGRRSPSLGMRRLVSDQPRVIRR